MFNHPKQFTAKQKSLLVGLIVLAFVLRLYHLDTQSLWFDESLSALFASQPLDIAVQSMLQEGLQHSPLFYLLLRPFAAGGFSEFSLRFLSVTMGVLTIPLMAQIGRVMANNRSGILAATFLAINPFHVWYSQETRMYAMLVVAALGAMLFFARSLQAPNRRNWLGLALFLTIGFNTHHFAFFVPLVQFIFLISTFKQNYPLLRPWVGVQLLAGLSFIPWMIVILYWGNFYVTSGTRQPPPWYSLAQTFWNFSIGYTEQVTIFVIVALSLFLFILALGIKSVFRTKDGLLLLLWLAIPPVVTFLVSFRLPMYMHRYLSLSLPAFLLLIAIGLVNMRRQRIGLIITSLVMCVMLIGLSRVYYDPGIYYREDWRSLGTYLEKHAGADDVIAPWYYQNLIPLLFYYHGATPLKPIIVFDTVDLPSLPTQSTSQKLWVIIGHPNNSAHLVGHCQLFNIDEVGPPPAFKEWRSANQTRLVNVKGFPCFRVEIYE